MAKNGKHTRNLFIQVIALGCVVVVAYLVGVAQVRSQESEAGDMEFPDLVAGLTGTPGCLGVETARTDSGKNVIFAWFKDKASVLKWYNSDMHQGVQDRFFPDRPHRMPLENVPADVGPIMAIASITFADKAQFEKTKLPISQIAIELYTPLTGGLFLGSRFAPEGLKVGGMVDYTVREP